MQDIIVLLVRFQTKPGQKARFLDRLQSLVEAMSVEDNFVDAIVHDNADRPDEVVVYETWRGTRESWMKEEFGRSYRKSYEKALSELIDNRTVDWLTPIEPLAV
jgi:quinol monooxygenase YgiN